jgi:hypothetical protein
MKTTLALGIALAMASAGCLSMIIPDPKPIPADMAQPAAAVGDGTGGNAPVTDMGSAAQLGD